MPIHSFARHERRIVAVRLAISLCLLSSVLPTLPAAHATNYIPTTTQELIDMITSANTNNADDTIDLNGQTFTLTTVNNDDAAGPTGLPIVLPDNGHRLTIKNGTIQRASSAPDFRILRTKVDATLNLDSITIKGGRARDGGGVLAEGSALTITHATITENVATLVGGGIYQDSGTLTINSSIVSRNTADDRGGGLYLSNVSPVVVDRSTTSGNSTRGSGGGLYLEYSPLTMTASTVQGNVARWAGGGIFSAFVPIQITGSTLSENRADGSGGAISMNYVGSSVVASTLSGNTAPHYAGILAPAGTYLRASILSNGAQGANCYLNVADLGGNLADDASCFVDGGTNRVVAPGAMLLGPVADNGGPTHTHRLLDGSPAIDFVQGPCTVDGTANGQPLTTDQRGQPRAAGLRCDAGSFERQVGMLQLSAAAYTVGEPSGPATIQVVRTGGTEGSVGVTITPADGSATAGGDYTAGALTVTMPEGQQSATASLAIINDGVNEPDESVNLTLSTPTGGASLGARTSATLTITNDDPVAFSVAGITVSEGNSGVSNATFTVTRIGYANGSSTVHYATADGTAKAGSDYTATSGTLTFAVNESSKTVSVPILGDMLSEPDETFTLTLSNPTNAVISTIQAVATIQNDDVTVACAPRPRVTQTATASGGVLNVHVEATPLNTAANNRVQQIRFGTFQNASVTLNGQSVSSGQTVSLPANSVAADFTVRRVAAGQTATVPFTVVDTCGEWSTFVGGGASAGF